MTDREQTRRDAEAMRRLAIHEQTLSPEDFADAVLALLAELEQAEQNEAALAIALWTICDIGETRDVEVAREVLERVGKTR